jgi:hypothetical protein
MVLISETTAFVSYWPSSSVSGLHLLLVSAAFVYQQPSSVGSLHHSTASVYQQPSLVGSLRHSTSFVDLSAVFDYW